MNQMSNFILSELHLLPEITRAITHVISFSTS